jgi:5-hydroxyisourate hydrolase-like protein (transthyretin family)
MDVPVIHVASVDGSYRRVSNGYRLGARVIVKDEQGVPVQGAQVNLQVTLPDGRTQAVTRTTNANGTARLSFTTRRSGTYTFTVIEVSKTGDIYNPLVNVETSAVVTIP